MKRTTQESTKKLKEEITEKLKDEMGKSRDFADAATRLAEIVGAVEAEAIKVVLELEDSFSFEEGVETEELLDLLGKVGARLARSDQAADRARLALERAGA